LGRAATRRASQREVRHLGIKTPPKIVVIDFYMAAEPKILKLLMGGWWFAVASPELPSVEIKLQDCRRDD
jgi:hypothetical protein